MRGRRNRPLLLAVAAVFVLVAVVAVASTGSTPSGTKDTRPPADTFLDTLFSLALIGVVVGAVMLVYGLMQRQAIAEEIASDRYRRSNLLAMLFFVGIAAAVYFGLDERLNLTIGDADVGGLGPSANVPPGSQQDTAREYHAEFALIPVLIIVGLIVAAVAAFTLASRRRSQARGEDALIAEQLADVLEETLDDLRAEPDPRRAVIAAYARLERSFASAGVPRRKQETAIEYVPRALDELEVDPVAVRRLTDLFTTAKFSQHPVDEDMKLEAISALERIRDDLRAAAARAAEPEPPGGPEPVEPAATS